MRKQDQKRIVQKMVVFSLVALSLIALLQLATQLPTGSAVGPQQQKVVTVTVYVPQRIIVTVTVYVQQPIPYPVTRYATINIYETRNQTAWQTVNQTVERATIITFNETSSDNIAWSYWSISSYTTTYTFTNSTTFSGTLTTETVGGVYTFTDTVRTTVSGPPSSATAYVTALLGVPIQPEQWAYVLLTVGGIVGLGFGYGIRFATTKKHT